MTFDLTVSGALAPKDIKRLMSLTRSSVVGPTATYYAGVTAPIISAAMAIFSKTAFQNVGMSAYWIFMLSALLAAVSGIVWYLIFMRWSYRHSLGRGRELTEPTHVSAGPEVLSVRRGPIETRIRWDAVSAVHVKRGYIAVLAEGADALIIPDRWFGKDGESRKAFLERLSARGTDETALYSAHAQDV
ncbi:MAG: YcxB family protein [Pseudomonadota bacterium]